MSASFGLDLSHAQSKIRNNTALTMDLKKKSQTRERETKKEQDLRSNRLFDIAAGKPERKQTAHPITR